MMRLGAVQDVSFQDAIEQLERAVCVGDPRTTLTRVRIRDDSGDVQRSWRLVIGPTRKGGFVRFYGETIFAVVSRAFHGIVGLGCRSIIKDE